MLPHHWGGVFLLIFLSDGLRGPDGKIALPIVGAMPTMLSFPSQGLLKSVLGGVLGGSGILGGLGGAPAPQQQAAQ
jgi:hypothetical protein